MGMSFEVSDPEEMCDLMCEADVRICPTCGKEVVRDDMLFTHDCPASHSDWFASIVMKS